MHTLSSSERNRRLRQSELARRWDMSPRTLERWRWKKVGPRYLKIGGRVIYQLEDIMEYERSAIVELQG